MMDLVNDIIAYESGELTNDKIIDLFARLVKSGMAWTLQGHYGRTTEALIDGGYVDVNGEVLRYAE